MSANSLEASQVKNNLKVAFFVAQFPSMSETFILNQVVGLIDRGFEVSIFTLNIGDFSALPPKLKKYNLEKITTSPQIPTNNSLKVIKAFMLLLVYIWKNPSIILNSLNFNKFGKFVWTLFIFYSSIHFIRKKQQFDIIYCHFGPMGVIGERLRSYGLISGKIITVFHGFDLSSFLKNNYQQVYRNLFDTGDLFLPVSEHWKNKLIKIGCPINKIIVHRMGVDLDKFSYVSPYSHPVEVVKMISISRLVEKKGIAFAISAVAKLLNDFQKLEYYIIGDGNLKEELQILIDKLGIGNRVKLLGWKKHHEISQLLQTSHIFLAPSITSLEGDQEGIPVSIIEAMAMGLLVVSTFHSGIPEIIKDNISGFLVPEKDVEALKSKLENVIKQSEVWERISKEARCTVEVSYDIHKLNDNLANIYKKVSCLENLKQQ